MSTVLRGYGLFKGDELIALVPAPPRMLDQKEAIAGRTRTYQAAAPVITEKAEAEGYRWSLLWEIVL
jgi:hypothetical protein